MRHLRHVAVHAGPVLPRDSDPDRRRTIEVDGETHELLPLSPELGEALTWRQPHRLRGLYWLESARGAHLLLHIPGSLIRTPRDCPVESANGSWTIHMGWAFSSRRLPLRDAQGTELMYHKSDFFRRGHIVLANGERLPWRWGLRGSELRDGDDQPLVEVRRKFAWFRAEGEVTVFDSARRRPDLLPLLALTWLAAIDTRRHSHG